MIALLLAAWGLQAAMGDGPGVANLNGRCQYPEQAARYRFETALILCDTLSVQGEGKNVTLDFGRRSWGPTIRFTGERAGRRLTINGLALRSGSAVKATGTCEIFEDGKGISAVACLAKAGSRSYAVNFIASRL